MIQLKLKKFKLKKNIMKQDYFFRIRLKMKLDNWGNYQKGDIDTFFFYLLDEKKGLIHYPIDLERWEIVSCDQYIGFLDKMGVHIFENDIVDIIHPCWTAKCSVKFMDGAFFFQEENNPVSNSQVRADKFLKEKWQIEVIGNIYK